MAAIKGVLYVFAFLLFFGSMLVSFATGVAQYAACGGCPEATQSLGTSVLNSVSAGQVGISTGVDGLKHINVYAPEIRTALSAFFLWQVVLGIFTSIIFIYFFYLLIKGIVHFMTGEDNAHPVIAIVIAMVLVGMLSYAAGGGFYGGWINLAANPDVLFAFQTITNLTNSTLNTTITQNMTG